MKETTSERKARERQDLIRKQKRQYRSWKKYLRNSKLSGGEIEKRAKVFTRRGDKIPND